MGVALSRLLPPHDHRLLQMLVYAHAPFFANPLKVLHGYLTHPTLLSTASVTPRFQSAVCHSPVYLNSCPILYLSISPHDSLTSCLAHLPPCHQVLLNSRFGAVYEQTYKHFRRDHMSGLNLLLHIACLFYQLSGNYALLGALDHRLVGPPPLTYPLYTLAVLPFPLYSRSAPVPSALWQYSRSLYRTSSTPVPSASFSG